MTEWNNVFNYIYHFLFNIKLKENPILATTKKQTKKPPEKHMFMQKVWIYIQKFLSLRKH